MAVPGRIAEQSLEREGGPPRERPDRRGTIYL